MPVPKVPYSKPFLTIDQQVALLKSRGLSGEDEYIKARLQSVNYYRLSAYLHPFRATGADDYLAGTSIRQVWDLYVFDRKLRLVVLDALERIEIAIRCCVSFHQAEHFGPFGYAQQTAALPRLSAAERVEYFSKVTGEVDRSKESFVEHFRLKYSNTDLPVWMVTEVMSFGNVVRMFNNSPDFLRASIANEFSVNANVLGSWLLFLNVVRNVCAHHGRLWNRTIRLKPRIPRHARDWHNPVKIPDNGLFCALTICKYMLDKVCPGNQWKVRLEDLIATYPDVTHARLGYPLGWQSSPIWI